jgi:hypothetical protein
MFSKKAELSSALLSRMADSDPSAVQDVARQQDAILGPVGEDPDRIQRDL